MGIFSRPPVLLYLLLKVTSYLVPVASMGELFLTKMRVMFLHNDFFGSMLTNEERIKLIFKVDNSQCDVPLFEEVRKENYPLSD